MVFPAAPATVSRSRSQPEQPGYGILLRQLAPRHVMRIILKIIAAPAVLALTLIVAVLNFSVSLASWVLGILSLILAVCGLFELFIQSNPQWGSTGLVLAFLLSPFGLPAAAEWLVCRLDDLNYSLKTFIAG